MKFAPFRRLLLEISRFGSRNGSHSNLYSTKAMSKPEGSKAELYRRICLVGDSKVSVAPILNQWVEEGRYVDEQSLKHTISQLQSRKRHNHALHISMWMNAKRDAELSSEDDAKRLPLVSKAKRMQQAVEVNGIVHDKMDKIVKMVEFDPKICLNWTNYSAAADGYRKAGLLDKALEMLKEAEACLTSETHITAYFTILRQYATIGKKDDVLRFWSFYKKKSKVNNHRYICFLSSLVKLGDFKMAEDIFYEWESRDDLTYDMNIPNFIIAAYSKKGLIEKAEALIDREILKGGKPNTWTWYCLVKSYLENEQPEKAVEMMKKAIVNSKPGWKPDMALVEACLEYLKGVGDNEKI